MRIWHTSPVEGRRAFEVAPRACAQSTMLQMFAEDGVEEIDMGDHLYARMAPYLYDFVSTHTIRFDPKDPFHPAHNTLPCAYVPQHLCAALSERSREELGNIPMLSNADLMDLAVLAEYMRFANVANAASILHFGRARPNANAPDVYRNIMFPHGYEFCAETNTIVPCAPQAEWRFRSPNASCL